MLKFKTLNNIFGWLTFLVATVTYVLTIEPTGSFWDCGEFISAAYKLQVVHPPGAPLFLMVERIFALLSGGDITKVAYFTNIGSALFSSFTILFLFWTITMFARKLYKKAENDLNITEQIVIIGSGLVGALAYTFSDSFWFSAVETEVYAMSSLFTAIVFWAILKWENIADQRYADRWLVFIAYMIGLSIGVHLLNLLAIPAIVFVYYFKRHQTSVKGIIYTSIIAIAILGFIQVGIIPGIISIAGQFDLLFVNSLGMPFWSGAFIWFVLLTTATVWVMFYSTQKNKVILHTAISCFAAIMIGYSSYTMISIRAKADPNINMYANDNIFNLLSYLRREQYGETPLLKGQYFTARLVDEKQGAKQYRKGENKYIETSRKTSAVWEESQTGFFPRIWSNQPNHISFYKDWLNISNTNKRPDFFKHNLRFFFTYQVGFMYGRYFMWNFAGKQNDIQGHGNITDGNWLTGIKFIDEMRLGPQSNLPDYLKENKARNEFYCLPLLLGLIGLFYHFKKNNKDGSVLMLLFFFTGIAIVIYSNQYPYQPRERDYAYVGSFYVFTIWIGLGVMALYEWLSKKVKGPAIAIATTAACMVVVPILMAAKGWNDHDRSGRSVVRDFAYDYLNSCAPNAILFTMGDNETYPLWYAQEVEGIRTDVRVVNLSLLGMDWYINQMKQPTIEATPGVPFTLWEEKYTQGTRDYIPYYDMKIADRSDIKDVINFISSDNPQAMMQTRSGKSINVLPTKSIRIKINKEEILKAGIVSEKDSASIVDYIDFNLTKDGILKNDLLVFDLLANNIWKRPIYFAITMGADNFYGLNDYLRLEGLAVRLLPVKKQANASSGIGGVNTDIMYNNVMNKFKWGNMTDPKIYIDPETARMIFSLRNQFIQLGEALLNEGKKDSCVKILNKSEEVLPKNIPIQYNVFRFRIADLYYRAGNPNKGNQVTRELAKIIEQNLDYYAQFNGQKAPMYADDVQQGIAVLNQLERITTMNNQSKLSKELSDKSLKFQKTYQFMLRQ